MPPYRTCRLALGSAGLSAGTLFGATAISGPPFRTDDPVPVDFQHFEMTLLSTGTKTAGGWSAELPAYEVNYGALPNLQLHALVPQGYTAPAGGRTGFALGDFEVGAKYRFITPDAGDWYPQIAVFPTIELPAGNRKLGFNTGYAQIFLPFWLEKDLDAWTIYGGGGYWINPGAGNKNYSFFGAALWREATAQLKVGVEVLHQTSSADRVKESTGFNVGATYDLSETWHLLSSVGSGIQNAHGTNQFSWYLAVQLTF